MHISTPLFQSYRREYGWWSFSKERGASLSSVKRYFSKFSGQKIKRAVTSLSFGQSCWNCIFMLPRSRAFEQHMTCPSAAKKSCGSYLSVVGPGEADKTALVQQLSKAITFFVLGPILVKFHIRTRVRESFPTMYRFWKCCEEKLHFTPVHTLRQLRRDEALFPQFRRVVEFRARYG